MHCDNPAPLGDPSRQPCIIRVPNSRGTVVLIGDSNAGQFTEPVLNAAHALRLDVDIVTYFELRIRAAAVSRFAMHVSK